MPGNGPRRWCWWTAWWHILTWARGTSCGGFNYCYSGGGGEGGRRRGGKEDSYVLLTEWRCKLKSAWQDRRTWDGHTSSPCIKGQDSSLRTDTPTVSPPLLNLHDFPLRHWQVTWQPCRGQCRSLVGGTGWVFLHLSPLSSRLRERIKVKKVRALLCCLWSRWAGDSELQSDYLLNSFQAEPPVTFEKRNNVSSRNAAFGMAEHGRARTPPNASLMYV